MDPFSRGMALAKECLLEVGGGLGGWGQSIGVAKSPQTLGSGSLHETLRET
jgi:hypothetical protein